MLGAFQPRDESGQNEMDDRQVEGRLGFESFDPGIGQVVFACPLDQQADITTRGLVTRTKHTRLVEPGLDSTGLYADDLNATAFIAVAFELIQDLHLRSGKLVQDTVDTLSLGGLDGGKGRLEPWDARFLEGESMIFQHRGLTHDRLEASTQQNLLRHVGTVSKIPAYRPGFRHRPAPFVGESLFAGVDPYAKSFVLALAL